MKTIARTTLARLIVVTLSATMLCLGPAAGLSFAESCEKVVQQLNRKLPKKIDKSELVDILRTLNREQNARLPEKFVTKRQAREAGWRPGQDLWAVGELKGKSIGGDTFSNRERKLPSGGQRWCEADLDYKGGHRGSKRLIFSRNGLRMVTVDHYRSFTEVPACQ